MNLNSRFLKGLVASIICALIAAAFGLVLGGPIYLLMHEVPSQMTWVLLSASLATVVFLSDLFPRINVEGGFGEYWATLPKLRILSGLIIYLFGFVVLLSLLWWGWDVYFGSGPGLLAWLAMVGFSIAVVTPIQLKTFGRVRSQRS